VADRKRTEADWSDLRIFVALARHGSLSGAARALSVNHATIARRLRSLEESIGERLVDRRPEGYVLTPAGARTLEIASDMEMAARSLGREQADGAIGGLIRINAPPGLASGYLTERLAGFACLHPGLDIDLSTNLRSVSLDRHEADIAVRVGRPEDGDIVARRLGDMHFGFYGTTEACASVESGGEPAFVGFDEANAFLPEAIWLARRFPGARLVFRAGNQHAQAMAARSGIGLVLLPRYIGRSEAKLRSIDLGDVPAPREICIVTRRRDRRDAAIRIVADGIGAMFEEDRALFE